jgi:hypothetical protein
MRPLGVRSFCGTWVAVSPSIKREIIHMRRTIMTIVLSGALVGGWTALANDQYIESDQPGSVSESQEDSGMNMGVDTQQPGQVGDETGVTVRGAKEVTRGFLRDESIAVRPQVGMMVFNDTLNNNETTSRAAYGFTLDMNAMQYIDKDMADWYIGPTTGLIFSHLGAPDSNFFGTDGRTGAPAASSNFFYIPLNLKAGYNVTDDVRVALHGGGNWTYRSVATQLDTESDRGNFGSDWTLYPNVGADFDFSLGRDIALTIRPDLTITPGDEFFTGTLALAIPIG